MWLRCLKDVLLRCPRPGHSAQGDAAPRLRLSKGGALTPPRRVLISARTRAGVTAVVAAVVDAVVDADVGADVGAFVNAGAAQSGTRQSVSANCVGLAMATHAQAASGQAEGCVLSNAGSCMQASKTRITCGTWSVRQLKRCALKICGTRAQSAKVGDDPWQ